MSSGLLTIGVAVGGDILSFDELVAEEDFTRDALGAVDAFDLSPTS